VPIANSADPGVAIPRAAPDSVESILESTGIADLRPACTAEEQERALRALGEQAMDLDPVRVALLRDRAIQALKAGGIESPARLVDAVLAGTRSLTAPGTMAGAALAFSPVEPWPEPVDGADLLGEIERSVRESSRRPR
jgi:hypothetical protein